LRARGSASDFPRRGRRTRHCRKCKKGHEAGDKTFKVHLDGYNLMPFLKGDVDESPRKEFIYRTDDGELCGIRLGNTKLNFLQQLHTGMDVWTWEFTNYRIPRAYNPHWDPFES
jgi:hypothetical protein